MPLGVDNEEATAEEQCTDDETQRRSGSTVAVCWSRRCVVSRGAPHCEFSDLGHRISGCLGLHPCSPYTPWGIIRRVLTLPGKPDCPGASRDRNYVMRNIIIDLSRCDASPLCPVRRVCPRDAVIPRPGRLRDGRREVRHVRQLHQSVPHGRRRPRQRGIPCPQQVRVDVFDVPAPSLLLRRLRPVLVSGGDHGDRARRDCCADSATKSSSLPQRRR